MITLAARWDLTALDRLYLFSEKNIYFVSKLVKTKQNFTTVEPSHFCVIRQVTEIRINFFKKSSESPRIKFTAETTCFSTQETSKDFPQSACWCMRQCMMNKTPRIFKSSK